jgi:hypothetical protein
LPFSLFDSIDPHKLRDRVRDLADQLPAAPVETGPPPSDEVVDRIRARLKASAQPSRRGGFHVKHVGDN